MDNKYTDLINITLTDNYFEAKNLTTSPFNPKQIRGKESKTSGVYIVATSLQLLKLRYNFTYDNNNVTFRIYFTNRYLHTKST